MTVARQLIVDAGTEGVYHCMARCVRRAFLCGADPYTGQDFEHRKSWVRERLETLAEAFAIEIFTYSVMSNHVHIVLRNRPDLAAEWSAEEVGRRWAMVFPSGGTGRGQVVAVDSGRQVDSAKPGGQADVGVEHARTEELRGRLCNISWFMKSLNEFIARQANREDGCRGRFWEGRFKCQRLLDEASVLTCMVYVDLNPVRAGLAASLADPQFTGAFDRIQARQASERLGHLPVEAKAGPSLTRVQQGLRDAEESRARRPEWLAQFGSERSPLPNVSERSYLELLDWTGRQIRADKPGHIPDSIAPLLTQLSIDTERWVKTVDRYGSLFYRVVGRVESMIEEAARLGRRFFRGVTASSRIFTPKPQPT